MANTTSVRSLLPLSLICTLAAGPAVALERGLPAMSDPPNVLIVMTDDQRADLMSPMPHTRRLFGDEGVTYVNGFANTPLCCPARASLFSGRFAHNHGVHTNAGAEGFDHTSTIQHDLKAAGYRTGIVGKFFNLWDVQADPPYFDRWVITDDQVYTGATYNVDGTKTSIDQYSTDYVADTAEAIVRDLEADDDAPWFLHVAPIAPHLPVSVAPEHADAPVEPWVPAPSVPRPPDPDVVDGTRRMLMSVDDLVAQLFQALEELEEAQNTLAFFVSDNGFLWNEHALWGKNRPYTESIRVPFLARWPGHLPAGLVEESVVAMVDIAPTILDAAGIDPARPMDGRSLLETAARTDMLTEAWRPSGGLAWISLRTPEYQYIEQIDSEGTGVRSREFYRLDEDPWQMLNLLTRGPADDQPDLGALSDRLAAAMVCAGTACDSALTSSSMEVDDAATSEGSAQAVFEVGLSRVTDEPVQVGYATGEGTATPDIDYTAVSGSLTIPAGERSALIVVPILDDAQDEPDETFLLEISGEPATVIDRTGVGTVLDDDAAPPPPEVAVSDASAGESDPSVEFTVTLSAPSSGEVSAAYSTSNVTATGGSDFAKTAGRVELPAGETSATISVPVLDDPADEPDETFAIVLTDLEGGELADGEATGTIMDDDEASPPVTPPEVSIADASAGEGDQSLGFVVALSHRSTVPVAVDFATLNGTAVAGKDYARTAGTLKLLAGETSATISVPVLGDVEDEPDEAFAIVLSDPNGATIGDGEARGTILDDDAPPPPPPPPPTDPDLQIADATAGESGGAMTFTVSLSGPSPTQVSVTYGTVNETAWAGNDYTRTTGTLRIPAGQTSATVTVPLLGDALDELDETFVVLLSNPGGGTIVDGKATGTIVDDDP